MKIHRHLRPDRFHFPPATRSHEYYRALLEHVVACARAATRLPQHGTDSVSTQPDRHQLRLPSNHGDSEWLLRGCASAFERDCKIRAAGELFAFELLGSLLGDFGRDCWQSTMRRYVAGATGHPEYADMEPWSDSARETSDIVYEDLADELTRLLVEGQYLNADAWTGRRRVRYYIEVKSTFGHCDGPFYMSERQRQLVSGGVVRSYP